MPNERLTQLIGRFARAAMESRQVARRLRDLLPLRYAEIRAAKYGLRRTAKVERQVLIDADYLRLVDELVEMNAQARAARVQYETHNMLFEARRSLRSFRAQRPTRQAGDAPSS